MKNENNIVEYSYISKNDVRKTLSTNIAEYKVIATLLYFGSNLDKKDIELSSRTNKVARLIFSKLTADDFENVNFRIIFKEVKELYQQGKNFEIVTLSTKIPLPVNDQYHDDSYAYLKSIMDTYDPDKDFLFLCDRIEAIKSATNISKIKRLINNFQKKSNVSNKELILFQETMNEIIESSTIENDDNSFKNDLVEFKEELEDYIRGKTKPVVSSGFTSIDRLIGGGWEKKNLIVVAARPGVGKTSFVINLAYQVASRCKDNEYVIFFSLEMEKRKIIQRLVSLVTGIPINFEHVQYLGAKEKNKIWQDINNLSSCPLSIVHETRPTITQIEEHLRKNEINGKKIKLIFIDYLQLIQVPTIIKNTGASRYMEVSETCRNLKELAETWDVPVIACAQLNRKIEDRKGSDAGPRLSDLRDSGEIEQVADLVSFLVKDPENYELMKWQLSKHRNGRIGTIQFNFDRSLSYFSSDLLITDEDKEF